MAIKVYEKTKQIIVENIRSIVVFVFVFILFTLPLPYYINIPGGLIDVSKRVEVTDGASSTGSFHLAYVGELRANIPTLIVAFFHPNWDILKQEEVLYENETDADASFRNHLLLTSANQNAIVVAFEYAEATYVVDNIQFYITYVDSKAQTNLQIGDELISVNEEPLETWEELRAILDATDIGQRLIFEVIRNDKVVWCYGVIREFDQTKAVGIVITEQMELTTDPVVELNFGPSESGPSGGLMMALTIYDALTGLDLANGLKVVGTGTIDLDGTVGSIGGVTYKLKGAVKENADIFFVPMGENYEDALALQEEYGYDIAIIPVSTFIDAVEALKTYHK